MKKNKIDWSKLDGMLMFDASKGVCASEFSVSEDTIERAIKKKYKITFSEYKRKQLDKTVLRLKQRMIKKALEGDNTCLIFTLKNISDWKDKQEVDQLQSLRIEISPEDANA